MKVAFANERAALLHGDSKDLGQIVPPNSVDSIVTDPPAGIGFMGKAWDGDKGGRKQWMAWLEETLKPSYDALKPGGHALVWAIPRTSHWTMHALEELGFEIRDVVTHLFGTGFPKSANISKAIDRAAGAEREVLGLRPDAAKLNKSTTEHPGGWATGKRDPNITAPGTPEAAQWEGFGTALKPAAEFWILCRKPLSEKTIAKNVLKWGTGALNIDGCRIPTDDDTRRSASGGENGLDGTSTFKIRDRRVEDQERRSGRWPAHLILDDTIEDVPAQFFYVAKPNRKEKEAGLDHLEAVGGGEATGRKEGSKGTENPRAGAGRTGGAKNFHPTVKSQALMTWLIRLITPPGGVVLDPFAGSGSTGVAALSEGFRFVGCEMTDEYLPITEGRLRHASTDDEI